MYARSYVLTPRRDAYNVTVAFEGTEWVVDTLEKLPEGTQPQISVEELVAAELAVREDKKVRALAKEVGALSSLLACSPIDYRLSGITPEQIHCDGWSIGFDDRFPKSVRLQQALLFARFSQHENLYAHPMVRKLRLFYFRTSLTVDPFFRTSFPS